MIRLIVIGIGLLILIPAQAHARELSYAGVWMGTLGKHEIRVCFEPGESSYYYVSHLYGIALGERDETAYDDKTSSNPSSLAAPLEWIETSRENPTGSWTFSDLAPDQLIGEWRGPGGDRQPIHLTRLVTARNGDPACDQIDFNESPGRASMAFNAPRIAAAKRGEKVSRAVPFGRYQVVQRVGGTGMRFDAPSPHAAMLNRFAETWLDEQTINAYDCVLSYVAWQNTFDSHAKAAGTEIWERELTPIFWTEHWLSLQDNLPDTFCGGAHSSSGVSHYTFDLDAEKPVALSTWFTGHKQEYPFFPDQIYKLLEKEVAASDPTDPEKTCASDFSIDASLASSGVRFSLSYAHVIRSCDGDYVIPYETLQPLMNAEGKAAVKKLISQ